MTVSELLSQALTLHDEEVSHLRNSLEGCKKANRELQKYIKNQSDLIKELENSLEVKNTRIQELESIIETKEHIEAWDASAKSVFIPGLTFALGFLMAAIIAYFTI
jgi:predicted RNase H-like nuclease (RuvC/YqgF family)